MDNKIKYWILLFINHESKFAGLDVGELFRNRPEFIDMGFSEFQSIVFKLEEEKLLSRNKKSFILIYQITKEGKKELRNYLRKISQPEYMSLMRSVPLAELRYRIKTTEGFLGSLILMIITSLIIYYLNSIGFTQQIVLGILYLLFFTFFIFTLGTAAFVVYNFLDGFIRSISLDIAYTLEKYKKIIITIFIILSVVIGVILFVKFTKYTLSDIIYYVIGGIILSVIIRFQDIRDRISSFFSKKSKK